MPPHTITRLALISLLTVSGLSAHAAVWVGGSGNWSSNVNPGWNGTGVPDGAGAVAEFNAINTSGFTTTIDTSARTVGSITFGGTANGSRSIALNGLGLFLNNNGAGVVISNTNTAVGSTNRLSFSSGTVTLQDNLLLSNTGGSTNTGGSIALASGLSGTGNVSVYNVSNTIAGAIILGNVSNFTGNVNIEKGLLLVGGAANALGAASNQLTLGSAGNGSASLLTSGSATGISNNITVTAGSGGTLTLGSSHTGTTISTYTGTILLNDNVTVSSVKTGTGTVNFSNVISGTGGFTKVGAGRATLSNANTYEGATVIQEGTLALGTSGSIASSLITLKAGAIFDTTARSLTMSNLQTFTFTLDATGAGSAGLLNAAALDITNAVVDFDAIGTLDDEAYVIVNYTSLTGTSFASILDLPTGYIIDYHYLGGNTIAVVTPEPSSYLLFAGGMTMLVAWTLRRRTSRSA